MGEMIKKYMPAIILLFIVGILWAGLVFFFDTKKSATVMDVSVYNNTLRNTFDHEILDSTYEKVIKTLPVSPKEFLDLNKKD